MKPNTTVLLLAVSIAAAGLAWHRSGEAAALRATRGSLARENDTLLHATTVSLPSAASAPAIDPAVETFAARLRDIAATPGGLRSHESNTALKDFHADVAALAPAQLFALAKRALEIIPRRDEAERIAGFLAFIASDRDPAGALESLTALREPYMAFSNILEHWSLRDPAAAQKWRLQARDKFNDRPALLEAVLSSAAGSPRGYAHVLDNIATENESAIRQDLNNFLTSTETGTGLLDAISKYEDAGRREKMLAFVGGQAAATMAPAALAEFCSRASLSGEDRLHLVTAAATKYIDERTPDRAAWMLAQCPDTASKSAAAVTLTAEWAAGDFNAAGRWIDSLQGDRNRPVRDAATAKFAEIVSSFDPAAASTWAATIHDPALQSQALHKSVTAWTRKDPSAAAAFVAEKGLPADLLPARD